MAISNTKWRDARSGKAAKFAFFINPTDEDLSRIERFISDYEQFVVLGPNPDLKELGLNDVDGCLALGYNFLGPGEDRTEVGTLEYEAKSHQSSEAIDALVAQMASALLRVPGFCASREPRHLTYMPSSDPGSEGFCLPRLLAEGVISALDSRDFFTDTSLVTPRLKTQKPKIKNQSLTEKYKLWESIVNSSGIAFDKSIRGATVMVIDDLCQSGTTMWNFARYLKQVEGANEVYGLVCVKSLRDTDNR